MLQYQKIIGLVLLLLVLGCKKKLFDHRNKYLGDWAFEVHTQGHNVPSIGQHYNNTFVYSGEISYGPTSEEIIIEYSDNFTITLSVDKDGKLSGFPTQYCTGAFEGRKKLDVNLRWGGLGSYVVHGINGEKK